MVKIVHENSIECFRDLNINERERKILSVYQNDPDMCFTDRQVAFRLGYSDMNCVRPRITELIDKSILFEYGRVKDINTGKTVRLVRLFKKGDSYAGQG